MTSPTAADARVLARYARGCIGALLGGPPAARPSGRPYDDPGASFVSLHWPDGSLQGCIGTMEAVRPLADDVARNAEAAAVRDPRARPLEPGDERALAVEVSILAPLEPLDAADEARVRRALRPGIDGVLFTWQKHRATFIPQMWAHFPDVATLLGELKQKAGLPADFWAPDVEVSRYTATTAVDPPGGDA